MTAFFDTSALSALANPQDQYHAWSLGQFTDRQQEGPIIINDVVYAEFSASMASKDDVDAVIDQFGLERADRDDIALFDAGQRFLVYRRDHNGPKLNVLSDYFIGAAARALQVPLVTANPRDFRTYFSGLTIVHPGGEETVP